MGQTEKKSESSNNLWCYSKDPYLEINEDPVYNFLARLPSLCCSDKLLRRIGRTSRCSSSAIAVTTNNGNA